VYAGLQRGSIYNNLSFVCGIIHTILPPIIQKYESVVMLSSFIQLFEKKALKSLNAVKCVAAIFEEN
jgi:hypothetical protein